MINETMPRRDDTLPYRQVSVEVVVPVYNEERALPESIPALCAYLETYFPYRWSVVIADNASTDATLAVAEGLASAYPGVSVLHLEDKGRGRALKAAWLASEADIVAYMDVDLSTNLWSFLPLVAPLATGHSDVAIGSRLLRGADGDAPVEARVDLALLQPPGKYPLRQPLLRRSVRLQGGEARRSPETLAAGRGRRVVLRHRDASARRGARPAHKRGTG